MLRIRLFQPFPAEQIVAALPPTVRSIAVLDRTKEPGAVGEPLYLEVVAALAEAMDRDDPPFAAAPRVIGGRYGLSSKEMTPVDDQADLRRARRDAAEAPLHGRHLRRRHPPQPADRHATSGIRVRPARSRRCSSGSARTARSAPTRRRSRSSARAPTCSPRATSSTTPRSPGRSPCRTCASGPSRSGRPTSSRRPTSSPATSSGCSARPRCSSRAKHGATFLLNAPYGPDEVWDHLPGGVQHLLIDKEIDFWVIDALAVADEAGMGSRINTVMQPCFFQLAGVLPRGRGDRADQGVRREDLREARRGRRRSATSPPSTARWSASVT